jgi:hypothetical protein
MWRQQWHELNSSISIRDLEQQAKGIEWCIDCRETNLSQGEIAAFKEKCEQLRNQAKDDNK